MITSIIALLLKLPALFEMLKNLAEIIATEIEKQQKKQLIKKMDQATVTAQKTKDTSDLENLFGGNKKP